ncbi:RNA polymerase subunit sigma-70 [Streptomyces albidoflavus]
MTEQPTPSPAVTAIRETIAQLAATPDPVDRAKALGAVLDAIPDLQAELRGERQKAVIEIRESKSIADTAELLGVTQSRISQIAKGISRTKKH